MIKAKTTGPDGAPGYLFGLSEENIQRLKAGQPIRIELSELGAKGTILIIYGKNEEAMHEMLKPYIGPNTKTHTD